MTVPEKILRVKQPNVGIRVGWVEERQRRNPRGTAIGPGTWIALTLHPGFGERTDHRKLPATGMFHLRGGA